MMLTANVNIEDRLVNDLVGKVMQFKVVNHEVTVISVKFNDTNVGLMTMQSDYGASTILGTNQKT